MFYCKERAAIIIVATLVTGVCYGGEGHGHGHSSGETSDLQFRPIHKGRPMEDESSLFYVGIDLSKIDSIKSYKSKDEMPFRMPSEEMDAIWLRLAQEFPSGTNFSIARIEYRDNERAVVIFAFPGGINDKLPIDVEASEFVLSAGYHGYDGYAPPFIPGLKSYVDLDKWNKEAGYQAAKKYIEERYAFIRLTFVVETLLDEAGEPDRKGYNELLTSTIGVKISEEDMIILDDGSLAVEKAINTERLNGIYNEPRIINIIPDLSDF